MTNTGNTISYVKRPKPAGSVRLLQGQEIVVSSPNVSRLGMVSTSPRISYKK